MCVCVCILHLKAFAAMRGGEKFEGGTLERPPLFSPLISFVPMLKNKTLT